ncbi:hypothetical protein P3T76_010686 [Phytophthora citrophthora]|uniref:Uncharacterized protein n=1 Tax=Phytophthora citrophthora TaxID=4793 RepID=A0AAD9GBS2_9STRA|nr:hypothetical protein P3T76_010686 [Phytophthora citrophthora]
MPLRARTSVAHSRFLRAADNPLRHATSRNNTPPLRRLVFEASPLLHGVPWAVEKSRLNRHILLHLKKQIKKWCHGNTTKVATPILDKWSKARDQDSWVCGLQSQTSQELWEHEDTITDYQVWVNYRVATLQLNLYYDGYQHADHCPLDQDCTGNETQLSISSGNELWWAICSIGVAILWQIWNHVVHEGEHWIQQKQQEFMWSSCMRQLTAVARSERRIPQRRIQGLQLQISLECWSEMVVEVPPQPTPPPPPPPPPSPSAPWRSQKEPELPKRFILSS